MTTPWMVAIGSWVVYLACMLQSADALRKPWAWLAVARSKDSQNYRRATSTSVIRTPFIRAISGVADQSALGWIPRSVELENYNTRAWNWLLLSTGSCISAIGASLAAMGKPTIDIDPKNPVSDILIVALTLAVPLFAAWRSEPNRKREEKRAMDEYSRTHPQG
ncbi:MAG: hypothetical protein Q4G21_05090 [Dermabacter sp.]|nr:hypothetical protein [Dermabacter sp.]